MATGRDYDAITANQPIGAGDLQRLIDTPDGDLSDAVLAVVKDDTTTAVVLGPALSLTYDGGANTLSAPGPTNRPAAGWWQGEVGQWNTGDDGFADVPFEDDGSSTYYVGLKHNDVPTTAIQRRVAGGAYTYSVYRRELGFRPTISSVADHGTGLRFVVTSNDLGPAFANVSDERPVTAWMVSPLTGSSEAVATGTVIWTGSAFRIDLAHYLGQSASVFSASPGDYVVHVHGLSINKATNLSTVTSGGTQSYLVLGAFDSAAGTFDYALQNRAASLEEATAGGAAFTPLRKAFRAGCYIGDHQATSDWNASANVTIDDSGDPVTFTFTNPLTGVDGAYIFTGNEANGAEPVLSQAFASGGLVPSLAKSESSGTYHIIAETDRNGEVALRIIPDADWTGADLLRRVLHVWSFDFTTSTGAVASIAPEVLTQRRGIAGGNLISSGTDSGGDALEASEIVGAATLSALIRMPSTTTPTLALYLLRLVDGSATRTIMYVGTPAATDLSSNRAADLVLGGVGDYAISAQNLSGTRGLVCRYDTASSWLKHVRTGGQAVDSAGRLQVEDLHFAGANGKLVTEVLDIGAAAQDGNWTRDIDVSTAAPYSMGWYTTTDGAELHLPVPVRIGGGTGFETEIQSARVFLGASTSGGSSTVTATLYTYIPSDSPSGGTAAAVTGASDSVSGDAQGWVTITPSSALVAAAGTRYFVRVTVSNSGGTPTSWVSGLEATYRLRQVL